MTFFPFRKMKRFRLILFLIFSSAALTLILPFTVSRDILPFTPLTTTTSPNVTKPSIALVTMTNDLYQYCAIDLLRSARQFGWEHPMYVLAIDAHKWDSFTLDTLIALDARILPTTPIYKEWLRRRVVNRKVYRKLEETKLRKLEVFFNPVLRRYDRVLYLDADGVVQHPLDAFVNAHFPEGKTLITRENGKSLCKGTFYKNEIATYVLTPEQRERFGRSFPDREMDIATCWFLADMTKLPRAEDLVARSLELLCDYRAAMKFNDQVLISLLFYNESATFPICIRDNVPAMEDTYELQRYCSTDCENPSWRERDHLYKHRWGVNKQQCINMERSVRTDMNKLNKLIVNHDGLNAGEYARLSWNKVNSLESLFAVAFGKHMECSRAYGMWRRVVGLS